MPGPNGDILRIDELQTWFTTEDGVARAVDGVSLSIPRRATVALVGESGCGKSVTALSILRLVERPAGRIVGGGIFLGDENLLAKSEKQMRGIRGNRIAMIFQEPMTALNPVYTVGNQLIETIRLHRPVSRGQARVEAVDLLAQVGIPDARDRLRAYPHHLSGGMRQRVMIAMALACEPELLIADEPTTALDVTIQAQILRLMRRLQDRIGMSILMITHDLAVVAEVADRVVVMYAGKIAERAEVHALFAEPLHPYTRGLFRALPKLGGGHERLNTIPGEVPNPLYPPTGCRFHPRCPLYREHDDPRCVKDPPPLEEKRPGHFAACWLTP